QREAVEAIEKWSKSVKIRYDWQIWSSGPIIPAWLRKMLGDDFFYNVYELDVQAADLTESDLTPLKYLTGTETIFLSYCKINDDGLPLKDLHKLRNLTIHGTNITDTGLKCLEGLDQLQTLSLSNRKITDVGLIHLMGMAHLKTLDLSNTKITDAGLKHLNGLIQLNWLNLSSTNITDEGLKRLKGMPNLTKLLLDKTNVTDAGVKDLQEAMPNLRVELEPQTNNY
ncbi:MAG: leucine-rich repeat domain-containing protein, partial [Thermoguttaceae bacterium]